MKVTRAYLSLFFALILLLSTTVAASASPSGPLHGGFSTYAFSDLTSQSTMSNKITLYTVPKGSDFSLYGSDQGSAILQFYKVSSSNFNPKAVKNGVLADGYSDLYEFTGIDDSEHLWNGEGDDPSEKLNYRFSATGYYYLVESKNTSRRVTMIVHVVDSKPSAQPSIRVNINGKPVGFSQPPVMKNGDVLVPIRPIFNFISKPLEDMNSQLIYNNATKRIRLEYGDLNLQLKIGSKTAETNGEKITLKAAPAIINKTVYVPVSALADFYGFDTSWNDKTKTMNLKR
ncbi:copper amine oxidase N-terminal domain-containing protein [Cohnella cholangitidis]|uniref:Copper amine oxidase N-terminal domain-containing protein n=1 Tax=Cohnella cholangitidis TaxID=2598458 RepID=A0A7G5BVL4_9BACL|nr:copper amine oxidase N-terminal domain-containing protein [Cohnella cholangitidis]QMV40998.1 copper amine oxidase N-terminal domain-containing protein [Cohnella cholangitidis]